MITVLVVDDSLTIRKWIVELLENHPRFEVVGEATNGKEAIHMAEQLRPNVITMDMMMPLMTGVAATEYIMAHCPTRILIVSASVNRGEVMKTYDALAAGAVSVVDKPASGCRDSDNWEQRLIDELTIVARVPVISHIKGKLTARKITKHMPQEPDGKFRIIAIGASTGGPKTVMDILAQLPADYPIPIVCVIHISPVFSTSLPEWLDLNVAITVKAAKNGDSLFNRNSGVVYLAPPDMHMSVSGSMIKLQQTPPVNFCRPAVDVLFQSVATGWKNQAIGILLTGMGKDGAAGQKKIFDAGGYTMAQDEASCTVFGMPQQAVEMGGVTAVLDPNAIASTLLRLANH